LKESNHLNSKGYVTPEVFNMKECINCKKCELICPEMAITIQNEEIEA
jgi:formate hydrogenlyase subunit 6/NADH:ubiquinone oxidoreductase subunit I